MLDEMLFPICHKISPPLEEQRVEEILPKMVSQKDINILLNNTNPDDSMWLWIHYQSFGFMIEYQKI